MKKWLLLIIMMAIFAVPVAAEQLEAPQVPLDAEQLMPYEQQTFVQGLWYVFTTALEQVRPDLKQNLITCGSLIGTTVLICVLQTLSSNTLRTVQLAGIVSMACILLQPAGTLISLGVETVQQVCQYGQLLLPVMTTALAAQGGTSTSVAIYTGTTFVNALLSRAVSVVLVPLVYVYLAFCAIHCATGNDMLSKISSYIKSVMTWGLKSVIYLFTGYLTITGVISGTTDMTALKAAKMTIAGAVPVVGNILSDASQTILLSASVMKNAAGVYGIYAVIAIVIVPFLKIALPYLLLKLTAAVCAVFGENKCSFLVEAFCSMMGFLLAVTGTVSVIQLISTVCFMKGIG